MGTIKIKNIRTFIMVCLIEEVDLITHDLGKETDLKCLSDDLDDSVDVLLNKV
jgi:hypothetical protein